MKLKRMSSKGQKWRKGQSCISNPQVTKYRENAKGRFFQKLEGESGLTKEALAAHNDAISNVEKEMADFKIDEDDLRSGGKSFRTFATNFTQCTIPAFERFFKNIDMSNNNHTRMLAIHAAAQEYMKEAGMPESSTSYFCSLMVSLEGLKDSEEDVAAILSLMARVIRRVHVEVLRTRFSDFAKNLEEIMALYVNSTNNTFAMNAIGSLSVLLRAQEIEQWSHSSTTNILHKLLPYTMHEKPKIRKSAQYNVAAILKASCFQIENEDIIHPGAAAVGEFCISQLRAASEMGNTKSTLHVLVFLRQVIITFPKKSMKSSCECVLSLMQLGSSLVNVSAMQAIYSLLVSEPSSNVFPADTNAALISALTNRTERGVSVIPGMNDAPPAIAWITVLTIAHINLFKTNRDMGLKLMPAWFKELAPYWQSEHDDVQSKVTESFQALLEECVMTCSEEEITSNRDSMEIMFRCIEDGLSYQYQGAWDCVYQSLEVAFKVLGPHFPEMTTNCVRSLTELIGNKNKVPHRLYLEKALGSFVSAVGPKAILEVVPLQVTGNIEEDEKNLWIMPMLQRYVKNTQLAFFEDYFVHMAGKCFVIINALKDKGQSDSILTKAYRTVENQIWGLLPSFCNNATDMDVALSNEKFARIICDHIRLREDTRLNMMSALRSLINDNVDNPGKLITYAKNYLPALFNIYLTKPSSLQAKSGDKDSDEPVVINGHRLAAYTTIQSYLKIVPQSKCQEFLGLVMKKYNEEKVDFKKQAFLDIARTFLPYIEKSLIARLYSKTKPVLNDKNHIHVQKAGYRLLEEMLCIKTDACQSFVTENREELSDVLLKSIAAAAPSSRASRLRCVRHLLLQLKTDLGEKRLVEFLQQVVGECVMCCGKNQSESVRKAAFLLLSEVGSTFQKHTQCDGEETIRKCMTLLLAGLAGSPSLAANSIMAATSLTYQYKDIISHDVLHLLIKNMCVQLLCHSREVVEASLSFLKTSFIIFPVPVMSTYVDSVMKSICSMIPDCQKKFRLKTRDIFDRLMRKFGADRIIALVPPEEEVIVKRLRNLRKLAARKKREREGHRGGGGGEDSDEDDFESKALPASLDEILAEVDSELEDDDDEFIKKKGKKNVQEKKGKKKEKGGAWIKETEDEIVDLLDAAAGKAIVSKRPVLKAKRDRVTKGEDDLFKMDKVSGKMIITEDKDEKGGAPKMDFMDDVDEYLGLKEGAVSGKIKNRKRTISLGSDDDDIFSPPSKARGQDDKDRKVKKKPPVKKRYEYGSEFRSKKAGGDMTKKDKLKPYAYVEFSKDRLNKRKAAKYEGQFTSLVRGARKGVSKGSKLKGRKGKQKH